MSAQEVPSGGTWEPERFRPRTGTIDLVLGLKETIAPKLSGRHRPGNLNLPYAGAMATVTATAPDTANTRLDRRMVSPEPRLRTGRAAASTAEWLTAAQRTGVSFVPREASTWAITWLPRFEGCV